MRLIMNKKNASACVARSIAERSYGLILLLILFFSFSCSTTHSFSVTADSMEKPNIVYRDSINAQKPW
ncbi:hypothetical protein [Capybara microvirus Cap1_SP_222]|nr:hypothetical protein [Capybara microvirus Cap1_SP_222]